METAWEPVDVVTRRSSQLLLFRRALPISAPLWLCCEEYRESCESLPGSVSNEEEVHSQVGQSQKDGKHWEEKMALVPFPWSPTWRQFAQ